MSDSRMTALKKALQMEVEGMAYYKAARDKATSKFGQRMFEYLRESEEDHIARIKEIYQSLETSGSWPESQSDGNHSVAEIFTQAMEEIKERQAIDTDDIAALNQAADFERRGSHFYQQRADEVTDPFEKAFYTKLAQEEVSHLKSILDSIQFLEDPQGFFGNHEPGTMAGI
ncbi:MAG: ferritin family protein [Pseudomonadota bacterium]|nr:MAG: ferritin family protein [Pseudomonadota bacterium]